MQPFGDASDGCGLCQYAVSGVVTGLGHLDDPRERHRRQMGRVLQCLRQYPRRGRPFLFGDAVEVFALSDEPQPQRFAELAPRGDRVASIKRGLRCENEFPGVALHRLLPEVADGRSDHRENPFPASPEWREERATRAWRAASCNPTTLVNDRRPGNAVGKERLASRTHLAPRLRGSSLECMPTLPGLRSDVAIIELS